MISLLRQLRALQLVYIICPEGLKVGDTVVSGENVDIKTGNALPVGKIPLGTMIHNLELTPGRGAQLVRSAGTSAQILGKDGGYVIIRLSSGEVRRFKEACRATIGVVCNAELALVNYGKAGKVRHQGVRPMNEIVGEEETTFSKWLGNLDKTTFSYSFVTPLAFIQNFYKIKLVGVEQAEVAKAYYLPFIIYNVLGLGSGALMVLLRDPSGEYAGDRKNRNKFFSIIVHLAFLSLLFLPLTSLDGLVIIIYVLCITLYYILLSVLGGSFKLNKMDLFTMLTVDVAYIARYIW